MFHAGVGAILIKRGEYVEAISSYLQSHLIASRVGNEGIALQASSNLALCFVRVGEYEKAIEWADQVRGAEISNLTPQRYLPAAMGGIFGNAMLGRARQAKTLIREHDEIFTNYGSLCMSQAWRFSAADSYAILGDLDQAQEQAWNADLWYKHEHPLGAFCRPVRSLGCAN